MKTYSASGFRSPVTHKSTTSFVSPKKKETNDSSRSKAPSSPSCASSAAWSARASASSARAAPSESAAAGPSLPLGSRNVLRQCGHSRNGPASPAAASPTSAAAGAHSNMAVRPKKVS